MCAMDEPVSWHIKYSVLLIIYNSDVRTASIRTRAIVFGYSFTVNLA